MYTPGFRPGGCRPQTPAQARSTRPVETGRRPRSARWHTFSGPHVYIYFSFSARAALHRIRAAESFMPICARRSEVLEAKRTMLPIILSTTTASPTEPRSRLSGAQNTRCRWRRSFLSWKESPRTVASGSTSRRSCCWAPRGQFCRGSDCSGRAINGKRVVRRKPPQVAGMDCGSRLASE